MYAGFHHLCVKFSTHRNPGAAGAVINGSGNSKTQTTIRVSTQILNIVLDVIIIKCFGVGVEGAAWALLFGSAVSAVFDIYWKKKLAL